MAVAMMETFCVLYFIASQAARVICNDSIVLCRNDEYFCSTAQETSSVLVNTVVGKQSYRHNAQSGPGSQGLATQKDRVMGLGLSVDVVQIIKDAWVQFVISC